MGSFSLSFLLFVVLGLQPGSASFRKGVEFLQLGRDLEAEKAFLETLEQLPGHPRAVIFLSRIYVRAERLEEAETILTGALEIQPDGIGLLNELGSFYLDNHRYREAEAVFKKAVATHDSNVRGIVGLAQSLSALKQPNDAILLLQDAISRRPGARALFSLLGTLLVGQARYDEALTALDEAEKLGTTSSGIAVYRGIALAGLGRVEEAQSVLEQVVQENPEAAEAQRYLGLLLRTSDPSRSVNYLREAARLIPDSAEVRTELALSLAEAGQLNEAQTEVEAARTLDPSLPGIDAAEGMILLALNRDQEALESLSRALEKNPADSRSLLAVGKILHRLGHLEKAEEAYSRATVADPTNADAFFYLGEMALVGRRFEEALEQYETACTLVPGYIDAHRQKGVALQRMGRHREAVELLEKALLIAPEDVELFYLLGSVLSESGDEEAAVTYLLQARDLHPYHSQTRYLLGVTLAKLGRREESKEELAVFRELRTFEDEAEEFEMELLERPDDAESYIPLIQHYLDHGRYEEALPFLEKASTLAPAHVEILLLLAQAWLETEQWEMGREAVDRVLALDPDNAEALALREKVQPR